MIITSIIFSIIALIIFRKAPPTNKFSIFMLRLKRVFVK